MSKLSKRLRIKQKRKSRKERYKQDSIPETHEASIFEPEALTEKGLIVTRYRLKDLKYKAINIKGFNYH